MVKISHKILTMLLQKNPAVPKSNALLMVSSRINSSSDVKTLLHSNNWLTWSFSTASYMSVLNKAIKIEGLVNHIVAMQPDTIRFMSNKTLTKVIDYTKIVSGRLRCPDSQISNNKILYFTLSSSKGICNWVIQSWQYIDKKYSHNSKMKQFYLAKHA